MGTTKLVDRAVKASGYPNRTALVSEAIRRAIDKARG
jgi:metal-responsive CopG/Arc/MetJ family transcriptional regulator